jgi:hypothetical protein
MSHSKGPKAGGRKKKGGVLNLSDVKTIAGKVPKKRLPKQSSRIVSTSTAPLMEADLPITQADVLAIVKDELKTYYGGETQNDLPMVDNDLFSSMIMPKVQARVKAYVEQRKAELARKHAEQQQRQTVLNGVDPSEIKSFLLGQEVSSVTASENQAIHERTLAEVEKRRAEYDDLLRKQSEAEKEPMQGVVTDKEELAAQLKKKAAELKAAEKAEKAYRKAAEKQATAMELDPAAPEPRDVEMKDVPAPAPKRKRPAPKKKPPPTLEGIPEETPADGIPAPPPPPPPTVVDPRPGRPVVIGGGTGGNKNGTRPDIVHDTDIVPRRQTPTVIDNPGTSLDDPHVPRTDNDDDTRMGGPPSPTIKNPKRKNLEEHRPRQTADEEVETAADRKRRLAHERRVAKDRDRTRPRKGKGREIVL